MLCIHCICWSIIHHRTPRQCCKALLENWVTTDNGVEPKTWEKLIEVLSEIEDLEPVIDEIKEGLISEGVMLYGGYVIVHMYKCKYACIKAHNSES